MLAPKPSQKDSKKSEAPNVPKKSFLENNAIPEEEIIQITSSSSDSASVSSNSIVTSLESNFSRMASEEEKKIQDKN
jgi:hypothetical protein